MLPARVSDDDPDEPETACKDDENRVHQEIEASVIPRRIRRIVHIYDLLAHQNHLSVMMDSASSSSVNDMSVPA